MQLFVLLATTFVLVENKPTPKPDPFWYGYWGPGAPFGGLDPFYPYGYWGGSSYPVASSPYVGLPIYRRSMKKEKDNPITKTIHFLTSFLPDTKNTKKPKKKEETQNDEEELQNDEYWIYDTWDDEGNEGDWRWVAGPGSNDNRPNYWNMYRTFKDKQSKKLKEEEELSPMKEMLLYRIREYIPRRKQSRRKKDKKRNISKNQN